MVLIKQYNLKTGLNLFGYKGEKSEKQFTQLHDMETFIPMDSKKLKKQ